jgi:hypothetical protein
VPILDWRQSARGDRPLLEQFYCTELPHYDRSLRRRVHPRPWELDVQVGIHRQNPAAPGLYLGTDNEGVGAVYLIADFGADGLKLVAVAVALRYRYQDGAVARETIREALATLADWGDARGQSIVHVFGYIDHRNLPSQRMCAALGFTCDNPTPDEEGLQQWSVDLVAEDAGTPPPGDDGGPR